MIEKLNWTEEKLLNYRGDIVKRRALISVWDKEGIVDFAKELVKLDWEIISTGGTKKALQEAGLKVIDVENITGFPEAFDGRDRKSVV